MMPRYDWLVHVPLKKDEQAPEPGETYTVGAVREFGSGFERHASFTLVKPEPALPPDPTHCPVCGHEGNIVFSDPRGGTGHFQVRPGLHPSPDNSRVLYNALSTALQIMHDQSNGMSCKYCNEPLGKMHAADCPLPRLHNLREAILDIHGH